MNLIVQKPGDLSTWGQLLDWAWPNDGSCGFLSFSQRMRMVDVQQNREIVVIAVAFDDDSGLSNADKSPLSLVSPFGNLAPH
jgi:hypothetical protein